MKGTYHSLLVPSSLLAKSKPERDKKVEAGLPYVGRNVGPIGRWRSIP